MEIIDYRRKEGFITDTKGEMRRGNDLQDEGGGLGKKRMRGKMRVDWRRGAMIRESKILK